MRSLYPDFTLPDSRPKLIHTSRDSGSSVDEHTSDTKSASAEDFLPVALVKSGEHHRPKTALQYQARLAFASGLFSSYFRVQFYHFDCKVPLLL
jgi:hypothetical protein